VIARHTFAVQSQEGFNHQAPAPPLSCLPSEPCVQLTAVDVDKVDVVPQLFIKQLRHLRHLVGVTTTHLKHGGAGQGGGVKNYSPAPEHILLGKMVCLKSPGITQQHSNLPDPALNPKQHSASQTSRIPTLQSAEYLCKRDERGMTCKHVCTLQLRLPDSLPGCFLPSLVLLWDTLARDTQAFVCQGTASVKQTRQHQQQPCLYPTLQINAAISAPRY